ncbi:hypothetical protein D3C77_310960 [compost metagenome]
MLIFASGFFLLYASLAMFNAAMLNAGSHAQIVISSALLLELLLPPLPLDAAGSLSAPPDEHPASSTTQVRNKASTFFIVSAPFEKLFILSPEK